MSDSTNDWLAETVRCTVFPADPEADVPDWQEIAGAPPETRDGHPRLGVSNESGMWGDGGGQLFLETSPGRIHLRISREVSLGGVLPTLGAAVAELRAFDEPWLLALPRLSRVAFGAVLLRPIESRQEGYELLDSYLPAVSVDAENSQDFLYRINRPRQLDVGENHTIRVNRLSTWSVRRLEGALITGGGGQPRQIQTVSKEYHLRLELDINTPAEEAAQFPAEPEQLVGVFDVLVALGEEIADQGEMI